MKLGVLSRVWALTGGVFAIGYLVQWPYLWLAVMAKLTLVAAAGVLVARIGLGRQVFAAIVAAWPFARRASKTR
jgi:hypothetical protein